MSGLKQRVRGVSMGKVCSSPVPFVPTPKPPDRVKEAEQTSKTSHLADTSRVPARQPKARAATPILDARNTEPPTQSRPGSASGTCARGPVHQLFEVTAKWAMLDKVQADLQEHTHRKFRSTRELMQHLDVDGDGVVSEADWVAAIAKLRLPVTAEQGRQLFRAVDASKTGVLSYVKLVRMLEQSSMTSFTPLDESRAFTSTAPLGAVQLAAVNAARAVPQAASHITPSRMESARHALHLELHRLGMQDCHAMNWKIGRALARFDPAGVGFVKAEFLRPSLESMGIKLSDANFSVCFSEITLGSDVVWTKDVTRFLAVPYQHPDDDAVLHFKRLQDTAQLLHRQGETAMHSGVQQTPQSSLRPKRGDTPDSEIGLPMHVPQLGPQGSRKPGQAPCDRVPNTTSSLRNPFAIAAAVPPASGPLAASYSDPSARVSRLFRPSSASASTTRNPSSLKLSSLSDTLPIAAPSLTSRRESVGSEVRASSSSPFPPSPSPASTTDAHSPSPISQLNLRDQFRQKRVAEAMSQTRTFGADTLHPSLLSQLIGPAVRVPGPIPDDEQGLAGAFQPVTALGTMDMQATMSPSSLHNSAAFCSAEDRFLRKQDWDSVPSAATPSGDKLKQFQRTLVRTASLQSHTKRIQERCEQDEVIAYKVETMKLAAKATRILSYHAAVKPTIFKY